MVVELLYVKASVIAAAKELHIKVGFDNNNKIYGSPRIGQALKDKEHTVARSYVARLMKKMHLLSKIGKKYVVATDSDHDHKPAENILQRDFSSYGITQSMSRKGSCWDNGVAESFFKKLKTAFVYHRHIQNKEIPKNFKFLGT